MLVSRGGRYQMMPSVFASLLWRSRSREMQELRRERRSLGLSRSRALRSMRRKTASRLLTVTPAQGRGGGWEGQGGDRAVLTYQ
jgi:hypothetical protein